MKSISPNIRKITFVATLFVSVGFIGISFWLLYSIIQKRNAVETLSEQYEIISSFEYDLTDCLEAFMTEGDMDAQILLDKVVNTQFDTEKYVELKGISSRLEDLKHAFRRFENSDDFKDAEYSIASLRDDVVTNRGNIRRKIKVIDHEINSYWNFSFILIGAACIIAIILAVISFVFYRSRVKISFLQNRNSLLMRSIADCVILCDNDGIIIDYNKAASKQFGFGKKDAIGQSIGLFYGNENDWKKVREALEDSNVFKGEIINKRINGEQFLSYLSANKVFDEKGNVIGTMGISRDISTQKQDEFQLQHIINNATDIIFSTDEQGIVTYINPVSENLLGYKQAELIGQSYKVLVHNDFLKNLADHFYSQFKNRVEDTYIEYRMVTKDGREIWVGQNSRLIFDPTNSKYIRGFFGVVRNLEEINKVMMELKESETKYRELFDNSMEMIQSMTPTGEILYVNESWKHRFGYNDEEVEKINLFDLIDDTSRVYCENILGEILKIGSVNDDKEIAFKMLTKSNEVIAVKGSLGVKYENNQVESIQAFLRDVTEQAAIEEALKKSEENFRLISNSINDVFFLYDYSTKSYDYISPNCEAILGANKEFFYSGENYFERYVFPEDRELVHEIEEKVKRGEIGNIEYRRFVKGELRWISEKWFPIINEIGDTVRISGVCRDITEMRKAYNTIYEQNLEISQSILYAKNIQESTLPTPQETKAIFKDSFVFYRAKDVLSGDLYIFETVHGKNDENWPAIIVGDCTGHGVPGGVLSLLCSGLLTESLTSPKVNNPAQALDFVRAKLIRLFRSNPDKYIRDGMDAAFCVYNPSNQEIYFAGANLSCFIVRDNEVYEYKGDKQPVGYSFEMEPFVNYTISTEEGDTIYITTDGYVDQFGGRKNKKFLKKRFKELLLDINHLTMEEQRSEIERNFYRWKGSVEQTDDIALIGVKL